ncbi:MAG: expansin EXLX1 family cellulose-binding protein, partial [Cyanobacteria bacterium P01_G01_bin.38]
DGTTQGITDFDPSKDRVDVGTDSIHTQIPIDTPDGLVFQDMFNPNRSLMLVGVNLKDLQAGNFAPIADAHLQQDLSAALAWENGTGLVRDNTVYIRSHEESLEEVVDFNPATDKISFFYLSVRGDNELNFSVEQTDQGVRFFSPITGQSMTLRDTELSDLDSSHFEWRANQLEDNVAGRMGLSDKIDGFTIVDENVFSGKSVPMAGLVDRAPYHTNPDYTGTRIGSNSDPMEPMALVDSANPVDPVDPMAPIDPIDSGAMPSDLEPTDSSSSDPMMVDPTLGAEGSDFSIGEVYTGEGTFYGATGAGNSGYPEVAADNRDMLTAINREQWNGSEASGAFFQVSGPKQRNGNADPITVMVVDQLPDRDNGLDLSAEAFAKVADPIDGIVNLEYELVSPTDSFTTPYGHQIGDGIIVDGLAESNPYWAAVRLTNHRHPVESLELVTSSGEMVALERQSHNIFVLEQDIGEPVKGQQDLVATDIFGQKAALNDINITSGNGSDIVTGEQFARVS